VAYARSYHQLTQDGFASFFHQRYSRTVVLLIAMGASRTDAEDAAQEAMILAWQRWESIREPTAWVRTTAVRALWRHTRKDRYRTVDLQQAIEHPSADPELGIFGEEQQRVLCLLRALPEGQARVAALFYDGLSCEEIAGLTSRPPATIRSQLRHARKTLKEVMASDSP
jgi:RNA polymerase sigma factor (sigma-70 family)